MNARRTHQPRRPLDGATPEATIAPAPTTFSSTYGPLELRRYPRRSIDSLQAFDSADEYLLQGFADLLLPEGSRVLVVNDTYGALALSLSRRYVVVTWGDSWLSHEGMRMNATDNEADLTNLTVLPSTDDPSGAFDAVVARVPKTLALFEDQLARIQGNIAKGAVVVAGGMLKYLTRTANELLERYVGSVRPSLGWRKARLLIAVSEGKTGAVSPYPTSYVLPNTKLRLWNGANVFHREGLDHGTSALLAHVPADLEDACVVDAGCGNGVLGLLCALNNPSARVSFFDESYMAVGSARRNWAEAFGVNESDLLDGSSPPFSADDDDTRPRDVARARFVVGDGIYGQPERSVHVVLCNPPFHQNQLVGDEAAWRMFSDARRTLVVGGALRLVGNRHLAYHSKLKRLFGSVENIGATPKFVVLEAVRGAMRGQFSERAQ